MKWDAELISKVQNKQTCFVKIVEIYKKKYLNIKIIVTHSPAEKKVKQSLSDQMKGMELMMEEILVRS